MLGLLRAEHSLAARLLASVGADLDHVRHSIELLVGRGETAHAAPLPVTPRLKRVLELARQEAKRLHSPHIRSEHILLGLAREGGGLAARMLAELGVGYEQLQRLVNLHLAAVIPGWALSEMALARALEHDDAQPITDPWVRDRLTMCAVERSRVPAAAHLLHYGDDPEVSPAYRGVGEISWFLAQPDQADATAALLATADEHLARWSVSHIHGWDSGLPVGPLWGVPDVWPHVAAALESANYHPSGHREALYGGWLLDVAPPTKPPVTGLTVRRRVTAYETRLAAIVDDVEVGFCDLQADLTNAGLSPDFQGWGWLTDFQVRE